MPQPTNNNPGGDQGPGPRAPLFGGGNVTGQRGPIFDREVPDEVMNVDVPDRPTYRPQAAPQAPTAPGGVPWSQPAAPAAPAQPSAPAAPGPAAPGNTGGDAPLTFSQRLEQARQKFDGGEADPAPAADPALAQRVAKLEGRVEATGQVPTMPTQQRDKDGNLVGDPSKPWYEPGSAQEPPSWADVIKTAGEKAVEGFMQRMEATQQAQQAEQQQADTIVKGQVQSLFDSGIIANEQEKRDLVQVAIKYGQTDLFKAAELWEELGRPGQAKANRQQHATQQRGEIYGRANAGQGPAQATTGKPTYAQIHGRSFDDIMTDAISNLDRTVR